MHQETFIWWTYNTTVKEWLYLNVLIKQWLNEYTKIVQIASIFATTFVIRILLGGCRIVKWLQNNFATTLEDV